MEAKNPDIMRPEKIQFITKENEIRKFGQMKKQHRHQLSIGAVWPAVWNSAYFCVLIFSFNAWLARDREFSRKALIINLIIFLVYFFSTIIFTLHSKKREAEKTWLRCEAEQAKHLEEYTAQVEAMYRNLRHFKHDYVNILTALSGYLDADNYAGLKQYFREELAKTGEEMKRENYRLDQLGLIEIPMLKGLLSSKLIAAHDLGVNIQIDITDRITGIPMKQMDLVRILGIFMDNAIEAACDSEERKLVFGMSKKDGEIVILVENTYNAAVEISPGRIEEEGYSTKGADRGTGLYNVREILKKYSDAVQLTKMEKGVFRQTLIL